MLRYLGKVGFHLSFHILYLPIYSILHLSPPFPHTITQATIQVSTIHTPHHPHHTF